MYKLLIKLLLLQLFSSSALALTLDITTYRVKVYSEKNDIFCHLDDPIENIACLAHDTAIGAKYAFSLNDDQTRALMAIELANLIQRFANSPRYSFYVKLLNKPILNTQQSDVCLINYYGICGNHQDIFSKAMNYLGIKSRVLSLYYRDKDGNRLNHAASEFFLNGKWRFIDITWAAFWLGDAKDISSLLSFKEVLDKNTLPSNVNSADAWFYFQKNPFNYLSTDYYYLIQYGGSGILRLDISEKAELFRDIPNYLGSNDINNEIIFKVNVGIKGVYNLKVSGIACQERKVIMRSETKEYILKIGDNFLVLDDEQTLRIVHKPSNICYVVFDKIELSSHSTK